MHRTPYVLCVTEYLSENRLSMNQHLTVAIWDGEQAVATLADAETWDQDQE
jgi:hypothetical protein